MIKLHGMAGSPGVHGTPSRWTAVRADPADCLLCISDAPTGATSRATNVPKAGLMFFVSQTGVAVVSHQGVCTDSTVEGLVSPAASRITAALARSECTRNWFTIGRWPVAPIHNAEGQR